jgi:two-component system sensor histidine kinase MprB
VTDRAGSGRPGDRSGPGARPLRGEPATVPSRPGVGPASAAGSTGPQSPSPQSPGPQSPGPQSPGPQSPGPQSQSPQSPSPQSQSPQSPSPQSPSPQAPSAGHPGSRSTGSPGSPPTFRRPDGSTGRVQALDRVSLRTRIGILAALVAALAVVLVSASAFVIVQVNLMQTLDANLMQRAVAAAQSELADPQSLITIPTEVLGAGDIRLALLLDTGVARSAQGVASAPPLGRQELDVARGITDSSVRTAGSGPAEYRVVAVSAGPGRALVIAQRLEPTQQVLTRLGVALPVVGGIGVVVAALAGAAVARTGLRPVQRLTAATERVASTGDLRPIPVDGSDELARLTRSFNDMLGALAASQEQQRRLVADAGHELRTPLTSMRTNLELLAAAARPGAPPLPESDRAEILEDVQAQIAELSTLVGDLVELAREDTPHVVHEPVELTDVVARALERARRRAGDVEFAATLVPWTLVGDATALERAVLNLLDNAAKWSPTGGTVRVQMRPLDQWWMVLEVADGGPGIAEQDIPRVFDRFYRAGDARTLPGSGLGLAIVRQVAVRHGGAVWAGRAPEGGALLVLRLPGRRPREGADRTRDDSIPTPRLGPEGGPNRS